MNQTTATDTERNNDSRPLAGIKVLAITRIIGAPFAAYQLALHGAEVIKIEEPGSGDPARTTGGVGAKRLIDAKMAHGFIAHAANEKSLTLNLRDPQGQDIFRKLV